MQPQQRNELQSGDNKRTLQLPVQAILYMRRHKSRTAFYRNIYMKVVLNEQFLKRLHTFRAGDMNAKQTTQETLST